MEEQPLSALRPGDRATIGRVEGGGPIRRRLLEMGLTPGTLITLVRLAPLRDPMEIRVRGYQLCVRRSEADAVWVRVEPAVVQNGGTGPRRPARKWMDRPAEPVGSAASDRERSAAARKPSSRSVPLCLRGASHAVATLRDFCAR